MASIMQHLAVAHMVNSSLLNLEGEELEEYLLGSVAADCMTKSNNKSPNLERRKTHFIDGEFKTGEEDQHNFKQYAPNLKAFLSKYHEGLNKPFIMGYFVHLATDKYFFERFLPNKVTEHLSEINESAKHYNDLTNKEYLTWYKKHFYDAFDDGDILLPSIQIGKENLPDFSKFRNYESPVEEVNNDSLHNLLEKLNTKYADIKTRRTWEYTIKAQDIFSAKEQYQFVEDATDFTINILNELGVEYKKQETTTPKL